MRPTRTTREGGWERSGAFQLRSSARAWAHLPTGTREASWGFWKT